MASTLILLAACLSISNEDERCSLITKWSGKFAQDTGLVGNIHDDALIRELFSKNPTFAPIFINKDSSKLFLRLSIYAESTADYEEVGEIMYYDNDIEIKFKQSLDMVGSSVMNQPFYLFSFSKACNDIIAN